MKIVLTGGGTGGHLFPLIAVAKELRKILGAECDLLYIGNGGKIEEEAMAKEGITAKAVLSGKKRRYFSWQNFIDPFKVPIGIIQSLWILLLYMPDAVFSKGGHVSLPVVIAAWTYRIPVLIHESDAVPGSSNRFLAKFAKRIAVSYPSAKEYFPKEKVALTGNPIRPEISEGNAEAFKSQFALTGSKPILLVLGGSQGSQVINKAIVRILPKILPRMHVIHQTGNGNYDEVVHEAAQFGIKAGRDGYLPFGFIELDALKDAFAAANLVISRAGANSIAEIAANGKPAILVPLQGSANNHQVMNAYSLSRFGGAFVEEENNLGENIFFTNIIKISDDVNLQNLMAEKIRAFHHPEAANKIAEAIIEIAS